MHGMVCGGCRAAALAGEEITAGQALAISTAGEGMVQLIIMLAGEVMEQAGAHTQVECPMEQEERHPEEVAVHLGVPQGVEEVGQQEVRGPNHTKVLLFSLKSFVFNNLKGTKLKSIEQLLLKSIIRC